MFALASISAVQVPPVLVLKKDHGLCSIAAANDESVVHLTAPCYLSCYGGTCRCRCCCGVIPLWLLSLVVVVHVTAFFSVFLLTNSCSRSLKVITAPFFLPVSEAADLAAWNQACKRDFLCQGCTRNSV